MDLDTAIAHHLVDTHLALPQPVVTEDQLDRLADLSAVAAELGHLIVDICPVGRARGRSLEALEDCLARAKVAVLMDEGES